MADEEKKGKPTPVGQYYLMEKIAQGGMAEIFKGLSYDVHGLKKTVCIKKILPQLSASEEFIDSLIDEAKLAVRLVHGNIAQTYDLGKVGDDYFMVMEYVEGRSLSQIHKKCIAKGELIPIPCLVYFISELLSGLDYMHRRSDDTGSPLRIVHRDISPQNIMVSYSGTVKIIDFGIAKAVFKVGSTDSGILKGKFAYMSPEQAHGDAIDQRSDIFSAGIILHEMLTGKRLFKAADSRQTIRNVRRAKVDPPSTTRDELPEELDRIAIRSLAKDRRHRYSSASEMQNDLVRFLYANYPMFKPSDAAAFVQELFSDEMANQQSHEADAKTPHLIIDRSNSALADDSQFEVTGVVRTPLNLREYMLEDTEAKAQDEQPDEPEIVEEKTSAVNLIKSLTSFRHQPMVWKSAFRSKRRNMIVIAIAIYVVAAIATYIVRHQPTPEVKTAETAFAEFMIVTNPTDAAVTLDGRFVGQGSPLTLKNIEAGKEHSLNVAKDGFITHERKIKLTPGEFATFSVALSPAAKQTATVEFITSPPGATVFIDDRETSYRTPAVIGGVAAGKEMNVGLFIEGYRFWSKKITLKGGETKSIEIELTKDFGSIFVDSVPSKALVMMDGVPVGQTPLTKEGLEPGKIYKVDMWLEGFVPFSEEVKTEAGRKEEIRATLVPEPKTPAVEEKSKSSSATQKIPEPTQKPLEREPPLKPDSKGAAAKPTKIEPPPPEEELPPQPPTDEIKPKGLIDSPAPIDRPK